MPRLETADGEFLDLLPIGTEVTHTDHPELRGRIVAYEWGSGGKVSPLPYKVYWTDNDEAKELIGSISWLYPHPSNIIPIPADAALKPEGKE